MQSLKCSLFCESALIRIEVVWEPALPPMPETIVMMDESATTFSIVPSKARTVKDARNAVARFTRSQGRRSLTDCHSVVSRLSSLDTPAICIMSSSYSSTMTSMISSTVMMPRIWFVALTTGRALRS